MYYICCHSCLFSFSTHRHVFLSMAIVARWSTRNYFHWLKFSLLNSRAPAIIRHTFLAQKSSRRFFFTFENSIQNNDGKTYPIGLSNGNFTQLSILIQKGNNIGWVSLLVSLIVFFALNGNVKSDTIRQPTVRFSVQFSSYVCFPILLILETVINVLKPYIVLHQSFWLTHLPSSVLYIFWCTQKLWWCKRLHPTNENVSCTFRITRNHFITLDHIKNHL